MFFFLFPWYHGLILISSFAIRMTAKATFFIGTNTLFLRTILVSVMVFSTCEVTISLPVIIPTFSIRFISKIIFVSRQITNAFEKYEIKLLSLYYFTENPLNSNYQYPNFSDFFQKRIIRKMLFYTV